MRNLNQFNRWKDEISVADSIKVYQNELNKFHEQIKQFEELFPFVDVGVIFDEEKFKEYITKGIKVKEFNAYVDERVNGTRVEYKSVVQDYDW